MNWSIGGSRLPSAIVVALMLVEFASASQSDLGLRIQVLEGSGRQNTLERIAPTPVRVRVVDRNNRPISNATVVFAAPGSGPGGDFVNGSSSIIVFTDEQGVVAAPDFLANAVEGPYQFQVRASYMEETAVVAVRQNNVVPRKSKKIVVIMAVAGAAAGAAFATRGGGSESGSPTSPPPAVPAPTVSFGGSSVGGPR
jgi:hypothetical protein